MWRAGSGASPRPGAVITPRPTGVKGANIPGKYSTLKGRGFSSFEYFEQRPEAGSPRSVRTLASVSPRAASVSPRAAVVDGPSTLSGRPVFKHSALPPAPKQAGAFQRFRYSVDPYEALEDHKRSELRDTRARSIAGAFSAGGNARDGRRLLKRRAPVSVPIRPGLRLCAARPPPDRRPISSAAPRELPVAPSARARSQELKSQLVRTLRSDWPSFLRVLPDERGVLCAQFASERLSVERRADLHGYMNRLLNTHPAAAEFGLNRDPSRWGIQQPAADDSPACLVYALRPPWVPNDLLNAHRLLEQQKAPLANPLALTAATAAEEPAA